MLRRAELPVAHTQGFNPRPKLAFALALGLGIEGRREVLELDLAEDIPAPEVLARLSAVAPHGLEFVDAERVAVGAKPAQPAVAAYAIAIPPDRQTSGAEGLAAFETRTTSVVRRQRPDGTVVEIDVRPFLHEAAIDSDGTLRFRLFVRPSGSARPEEFLEALGLRDLLRLGSVLARTDLELRDQFTPPNTSEPTVTDSRQPQRAAADATPTPHDRAIA